MRSSAFLLRAMLCLAAATSETTIAQPVADFYRGKTIELAIGAAAAGGYDVAGRYLWTQLPLMAMYRPHKIFWFDQMLRVRFEAEPSNLENAWVSLMSMHSASGSTWTDAYLAAFAIEAKFRLISFDRGMRRWPGLALEL